jgi:D-alanyl-lipoteichoic acid acyltransferase DltB (MBOAT superfamily)
VQLYLEFSAYTDISVAISNILGYKTKHNFNAPFFSQTVSEFWRSWHMSLSHWFADYVFTPLQFVWRKYGIFASVFAALVTLTVSGLWHGIAPKFFLYGFLMGCFVAADALLSKKRKKLKKELPKSVFVTIGIALTMLVNVLLIVFFRVPGIHDSLAIICKYILNPTTWSFDFGLGRPFLVFLLLCMAITVCSHGIEIRRERFFERYFSLPWMIRWVGYYALILALMFFGVYEQSSFVYFQF